MIRRNPHKSLEQTLGVRFRRKQLLERALTHPSHRHENAADSDNQRLEFLGDAVLGLLAAEHLFGAEPKRAEGPMTKARSELTNRTCLATIAERMDLGPHLRLGKGEAQSGGGTKASNLADAVEAIIGAAYVDGGFRSARKIFAKWFVPAIAELEEAEAPANPKGDLQEFLQAAALPSPVYRILESSGPSHGMRFVAGVFVDTRELARGEGTSKRLAEANAAQTALADLRERGLEHLRE